MTRKILCSLLTSVAALLGAGATAAEWTSEFEAARNLAGREDKDLLLEFIEPDSCDQGSRLKLEVLDQSAFSSAVTTWFVRFGVEVPRNQATLDATTRSQIVWLRESYGIEEYPTLILADAGGRPYARAGYEPGGVDAYLKHLEELRNRRTGRDRAFAEANSLQGVEKARALQKALSDLDDRMVDRFYPEVLEQIATADPDDETGFSAGRDYRMALTAFESKLETLVASRDHSAIVAAADTFISAHRPHGLDRQRILMSKALALVEMDRKEDAFEVIDTIRKEAPHSELCAELDLIQARVEVRFRSRNPPPAPIPESQPAAPPASRPAIR